MSLDENLHKFNFKDQGSLDKAIQDIEKFDVSMPGPNILVTSQYLKESLENLGHAKTVLLMYEKQLLSDLSALKSLLRIKKSMYSNKINAIIMQNENKVSYIAKRTHAENVCNPESTELAELEGFKDVLEGYMGYFKNKKADIKQVSSDLKLLYKAFLLDNKPERTPKPIDPYKQGKNKNPWLPDQGLEKEDLENDVGTDLSEFEKYIVNVNM